MSLDPGTSSISEPLWQRRLTAIAEIVLCSSVPTQLTIGVVLRLAGWAPLDADGHLSLPYVVVLSLADFVLLVALMIALMRLRGQSPRAVWMGTSPISREALRGVLFIPVVFLIAVVLMNGIRMLAPGLHNVAENPLEQLARTPRQAIVLGLVAIVAGGVREELQRAFLIHRFDVLGGPAAAVIVLSIAFGLGHVVQGWDAVVATGMLGAFWAVMYLRRRSAIAPIVSHAGFNAMEILRAATLT